MPYTIDKDGNASVTCECGKPLTEVNALGMFCEDFCGLDESIQVERQVTQTIDELNKIFDNNGLNDERIN